MTSKVRVLGSACAADLAHAAGSLDAGLLGQEDGDVRVGRGGADHLRRHVEDGVAPALAGQPDDHLAGLHHLARLRADRGHHPLGIRVQLGEADLVFREPELRLRRLDLRPHRLPRLPRPLVDRPRREAALLELALALILVLGLAGLALGGGEIGLRRAQRVELVLRIEPADQLAGLDCVARAHTPLDHPPGKPEGQPDLVLGLDPARQHDGDARLRASRP